MEQVALAVECCAQRWRRSTTRERLVLQLSKINWHRGLRGGVASSAVSSVEVYHDHGGRQRECHIASAMIRGDVDERLLLFCIASLSQAGPIGPGRGYPVRWPAKSDYTLHANSRQN